MAEVRNAKIASTSLGIEGHVILTAWLTLDGDGWGVGYGGMAFDGPLKDADGKFVRRCGAAYGMEWVRLLLETLVLERWEQLPGTLVRVETEGWGGRALRIGHITKDRWFSSDDVVVPDVR